MNLLVVENDRSLLAMLEAILTPRYMMTRAESCKRAGDLLEIQPFDIAVPVCRKRHRQRLSERTNDGKPVWRDDAVQQCPCLYRTSRHL